MKWFQLAFEDAESANGVVMEMHRVWPRLRTQITVEGTTVDVVNTTAELAEDILNRIKRNSKLNGPVNVREITGEHLIDGYKLLEDCGYSGLSASGAAWKSCCGIERRYVTPVMAIRGLRSILASRRGGRKYRTQLESALRDLEAAQDGSSVRVDLRAHLARVLDKTPDELTLIHVTPDGKFEIIPAFMALSNKDRNQSGEDLRTILTKHPEVQEKILNFKFKGRGQRDTPVTDLQTLVELIMLHPCKAAVSIRKKVCEVFVMYLGGSQRLIDETIELQHIQNSLKDEGNESHPLRAFGRAIETIQGAYRLDVEVPAALRDDGHLYFAQKVDAPGILKVARTKNLEMRNNQHTNNGVRVVAFVPHGFKLEGPLHKSMERHQASTSDGVPGREREWFKFNTPEEVVAGHWADAVAIALTKQTLAETRPHGDGLDAKRRRVDTPDGVEEAKAATAIVQQEALARIAAAEADTKVAESRAKIELMPQFVAIKLELLREGRITIDQF
jgi:hypothetical protein